MFFYFLLFFCNYLSALEIPKQIKGVATEISPAVQEISGEYLFTFSPPQNWGLGEILNGTYHFYPRQRGFGCSIQLTYFDNPKKLQKAFDDLKSSISLAITPLENGFELTLDQGWFSCQKIGQHLVQFWYLGTKKELPTEANWNQLKKSVAITPIKEPLLHTPRGWLFFNQKDQVLFKDKPPFPTQLVHQKYLAFSDHYCSGYFFLTWENVELKEYLDFCVNEIKSLLPTQKWDAPPETHFEYIILRGRPYGIIVFKTELFVCAFAVRSTSLVHDYDIQNLIERVCWN